MRHPRVFVILMILAFGCSGSLSAQNSFWDKVQIRKGFQTGTPADAAPAIASFTLPKDSASSYLINAGIGYTLDNYGHGSTFSGFFTYNHNTLISAAQKSYQLGVSNTHNIWFGSESVNELVGINSIQYMHNWIDTTNNIILTSYWHPFEKSKNGIHIGGYVSRPHVLDYFLLPQAGLEYQDIIDMNSTTKKGYDVRAYFNGSVNLKIKKKQYYAASEMQTDLTDQLNQDSVWAKMPVKLATDSIVKMVKRLPKTSLPKSQWPKLLEFIVSYTGRSSFINKNSNFDHYLPLFTAGLSIYPVKDENFSIGFSYNDGMDPIAGTKQQTFWLLSLQYKK